MKRVGYYVDLSEVQFFTGENGAPMSWVHALPGGTYQHPIYGEMKFTDDRIKNFANSVTQRYRKVDPDIDYDHKQDASKGNKAAGWVKTAETRLNGETTLQDLWLLVEWTPGGAQSIRDKEYRYFSAEIADEWEDNQGTKYQDVLFGGGVTNRPYMKQLLPLNLSELSFGEPGEPTNEGEQVDPKELRRKLRLSESATDAEVDAKLAELTKLSDPKPPADDPMDAIAKLAEGNPVVRAFMEQMQSQSAALSTLQKQYAETAAANKLSALVVGQKVTLTPVVLNEAKVLLAELPTEQGDKVFAMLKAIVEGNGTVQLGEFGTTDGGKKNSTDKSKKDLLNEKIAEYQKNDNLSYADALERVVKVEPQLYSDYQKELMTGGNQ